MKPELEADYWSPVGSNGVDCHEGGFMVVEPFPMLTVMVIAWMHMWDNTTYLNTHVSERM